MRMIMNLMKMFRKKFLLSQVFILFCVLPNINTLHLVTTNNNNHNINNNDEVDHYHHPQQEQQRIHQELVHHQQSHHSGHRSSYPVLDDVHGALVLQNAMNKNTGGHTQHEDDADKAEVGGVTSNRSTWKNKDRQLLTGLFADYKYWHSGGGGGGSGYHRTEASHQSPAYLMQQSLFHKNSHQQQQQPNRRQHSVHKDTSAPFKLNVLLSEFHRQQHHDDAAAADDDERTRTFQRPGGADRLADTLLKDDHNNELPDDSIRGGPDESSAVVSNVVPAAVRQINVDKHNTINNKDEQLKQEPEENENNSSSKINKKNVDTRSSHNNADSRRLIGTTVVVSKKSGNSGNPYTSNGGSGGESSSNSNIVPVIPHSIASQLMLRSARGQRQYDVPQIECPPAMDGMERFACPTPDRQGRYRCIDDHVLCDGFIDCPKGEDEDRQACMFYKTTKAHLDVLADALLRWARGR